MSRTVLNASEQLGAGIGVLKSVEVDVGTQFVGDATFFVDDAAATPTSHVTAQVLGITPSDGRSTEEIYLEQVNVFATSGAGRIRFDLQPKLGRFQGKFVIGYQVA